MLQPVDHMDPIFIHTITVVSLINSLNVHLSRKCLGIVTCSAPEPFKKNVMLLLLSVRE